MTNYWKTIGDKTVIVNNDGTFTLSQIVQPTPTANINGTSLQGYIDCSYADLVAQFGPPMESDGYKVDAEWILTRVADGAPITIYNYKTGRNYLGDEGQETEDITDWHIGGHDASVVETVQLATGKPCRTGW